MVKCYCSFILFNTLKYSLLQTFSMSALKHFVIWYTHNLRIQFASVINLLLLVF